MTKTKNSKRVKAAKRALTAYREGDPYDNESNVIDLLTDLRHYCDRYHLDFADLDRSAYGHYIAEVNPTTRRTP